ncbi:MAG: sulfotransferase domain-containing protein [Rickettsiales bacterium]
MKPNFFIVGAPKCGTTALASYLNDRDDVLISEPKEPHYFADDFPHYKKLIPDIKAYEYLFSIAEENKKIKAVGEASVWYLYSQIAVENIYSYRSDAKIIIMIRDPIDVIESLHRQLLWTMDEDEKDINKAVKLAKQRRQNLCVPKSCREPKFLQYVDVVKFGKQIESVYKIFPRSQVMVIEYEEFKNETKKVYSDVTSFLGLEDDCRDSFPRINQRKESRSKFVAKITQRPPDWLVYGINGVKKITGKRKLGLMKKLIKLNSRPAGYEKLCEKLKESIRKEIDGDMKKLQIIIGRENRF